MSFRIVTTSSNSVCLQSLLLLLSNECLKNYDDGFFFSLRKKTSLQSMKFEK